MLLPEGKTTKEEEAEIKAAKKEIEKGQVTSLKDVIKELRC
jgi:hypothetical protein